LGIPNGIVGYADFSADNIESILQDHLQYRNFRGIRQMLDYHPTVPAWRQTSRGDWMSDPKWRAGFALLEKYQLSFDLQIHSPQMREAADLIKEFPNIQFILNHVGFPFEKDEDSLELWRGGLKAIAQYPNVAVKISALVVADHSWTIDSLRPFVLCAINTFGVHRCMFASNFPVDKIQASFEGLFSAYKEIVKEYSRDDQKKLFSENALHFYRLN